MSQYVSTCRTLPSARSAGSIEGMRTDLSTTLPLTHSSAIRQLSMATTDGGDEMLWKLVEEAGTNLVAYSEEVATSALTDLV